MVSQECNTSFQQYILLAAVFIIIILVIITCVACICSRGQKWSKDYLRSYEEKWKRIEYLSTKEDTRPLAIIYACSLLDYALKTRGYLGDTLNERLNSAQNTFIANNGIWKVHRKRNQLAHDADMEPLNEEDAKQYLKIIRQGLFDLNVFI
jgi:hypothetical protein